MLSFWFDKNNRTHPQENQVRSLGQKLRRFAEKVGHIAGQANGERIRQWITRKKDGWYTLFRNPELPATSTLLDQAHNALDRKLFMMKGFHHPEGNQRQFLTGLALLYNFGLTNAGPKMLISVGLRSKEASYPPLIGYSTSKS